MQRVQELLHRRGAGTGSRQRSGALLGGLVFCGPCGRAMSPGYACRKGHLRYRYYLCSHAQKHGRQACPAPSIPAATLERFVVGQIRALAADPDRLQVMVRAARDAGADPNGSEADEAVSSDALEAAAWDHLPVARQADLLRRLVRRIDYDGANTRVRITFLPGGIRALAPTEERP